MNAATARRRCTVADAEHLLLEMLAYRALPTREVELAAEAAEISESTLKRARRKLGVRAEHIGFGPGSWWVLDIPRPAPAATETPGLLRSPLPDGTPWTTERGAGETHAEHRTRHLSGYRFLAARQRDAPDDQLRRLMQAAAA